jgi:hypothetical protein
MELAESAGLAHATRVSRATVAVTRVILGSF